MTGERSVRIPSGGIELEGRLFVPPGPGPAPGAVLCHPHPLYGGNQENNVVRAVARALQQQGWATLRFNFRGVGASGGSHGGGGGEQEDVAAALEALVAAEGVDAGRIALVGYSFGAWAATEAAAAVGRARALVAVAPPLAMYPMEGLARCRRPRLVVVGDRDGYCPLEALERWVSRAEGPLSRVVIPGADHFFLGREGPLAEAVARFLNAVA